MDIETRHILECLEQDAKITHEEIASLTGLPVEYVTKRIKELEDIGVIRKYKTVIDWDLAGDEHS
jgi:DNA-binding Lrp family transcriptional regulator